MTIITKKTIRLALIILFGIFLTGCASYQNAKQYNKLSDEHNTVVTDAFAKMETAVDAYNGMKFDEAKKAAELAQQKFAQSADLSNQAKDVAQKLPERDWLVDFKAKSAQAEQYKEETAKLIAGAADAQIKGDKEAAKTLTDKINELEKKFQELKKEIDQVRADHKEFFKD